MESASEDTRLRADLSFKSDKNETQCLNEVKRWLETDVKFHARKDDDFLLIFLRGCKFNVDKTKKKMSMYYDNRRRVPQWWADRNVEDLEHILQQKTTTVMMDEEPQLPTVVISQLCRTSDDSSLLDKYMKNNGIAVDVALRRRNCQFNGLVWIVDMKDQPLWTYTKVLYPTMVYNMIHSFTLSTPIRLKGIHVLNFPLIGRAAWQITKPMLPLKIRNRFYFYGSDLSSLKDNLDNRLLPEEYGGCNGSIEKHHQMYIQEVHNFSDYLKEDDKYGFQ